MPRYDSEWIQDMLQPERRGSPSEAEIVRAIGILPGDIVADIGCGPGFLTIPAAQATGPLGRVDAIDVEHSMLEIVRQRATAIGLTNIVSHVPSTANVPLANESVDVAVCSLLLHDLDDPEAMLQEIARITRPSGKVAIVEWVPDPLSPRSNRITAPRLSAMLTSVGLDLGEQIPLPSAQYLIVGIQKPVARI